MAKLQIILDAKYDRYDSNGYDENIYSYNNNDLSQYIDYGNISVMGTRELMTIKKSNKRDALVEAHEYYLGWVGDEMTKDELIEALYGIEFPEIISRSWLNRDGIESMLDVTFKFEIITTMGYSQGDVRDVVIPHSLISVWGCGRKSFMEQCENDLKKEIGHYFWDSPIVGNFSLSFEYYKNCVTHSVSLEYEELREVLLDEYELSIDVDVVLSNIEREMGDNLDMLTPEDRKQISSKLSSYDYTDVEEECYCA